MASPPTTEKAAAWILTKAGSPLQHLKKQIVDVPQPTGSQVLVKVHAAALNPVDWKFTMLPRLAQTIPRVMGGDLCGSVLSYGPSVSDSEKTRLPVGKRVFGLVHVSEQNAAHDRGTLATHATVESIRLAPVPEGVEDAQAAGLALVGMTAHTMLVESGFKKGDRVLVLGGSTSVGLLLLQMLKHDGAELIVSIASGEKIKPVKERGADVVFDYRQVDVAAELKKEYGAPEAQFDVILDSVGDRDVHMACVAFLKPKGCYYNVGAGLDPGMSFLRLFGFLVNTGRLYVPWFLGGVPRKSLTGRLNKNCLPDFYQQYIQNGVARGLVDSSFVFDDVVAAYEKIMGGRAMGKIVVTVAP